MVEHPAVRSAIDESMETALGHLGDPLSTSLDDMWHSFKGAVEASLDSVDTTAPRKEPPPSNRRSRGRTERRLQIREGVDEINQCRVDYLKGIWRILDRSLGKKTVPRNTSTSMTADKVAAYMSELYQSCQSQASTREIEELLSLTPSLDDTRDADLDSHPLPEPIQRGEVIQAINALKSGRGTGVDGIPAELLKSGDGMVSWLQLLCDRCFRDEDQPKEWMISKTTMIYKGRGKKNDCSNYRTVLCQASAAKVYSIIILGRIYDTLNSSVGPAQAAFRRWYTACDCCQKSAVTMESA